MIYRIELDGTNIYGTQPDLSLVSPSVSIELNSAGSAHFTMTKGHKYYDLPQLLTSDIDIYENDKLIWFGRVLEINMSMNLNKEIVGEGPLAYFNDTIQRPETYENVSIFTFFESVIEKHNSLAPQGRMFTVGRVTIPNVTVYRETNYETTKEVLESMCLNAEGGYFFFRKEDGVNYIDWLADIEEESIQPVKFGLNLVDISKDINGGNIKTAILPLGQEIDGQRITIESVNHGLDYLDSEAVATYGRILEVVTFDEIARPDELLTAAENWLASQELSPLTIKCDAAELNYLNEAYPAFSVGQNVHVESIPHLIDTTLPLTNIDIDMDSAVKKISIGTQEKRELSEIYKSDSSGSYSGGSSGGGGGGGGGGTTYTSGPGIRIAGGAISVRLGYGLAINAETGNIDVTVSPSPASEGIFSNGINYSPTSPVTDIHTGVPTFYQEFSPVSDTLTDGEIYEPEEGE